MRLLLILFWSFVFTGSVWAENIDPYDTDRQYAWGENVGWLNFEPGQGEGVTVSRNSLSGYLWSENVGWINLSPGEYGGVLNDGSGNLSGYGWGENVGWINFDPQVPGDPTCYGVKIDQDGNFQGWAWGETIGWIHLNGSGAVDYGVQTGECPLDTDRLENWTPVKISNNQDRWLAPRIAVHEDSIHVVWYNLAVDSLIYRRSTDGGLSWDDPQILASGTVHTPAIAVSGQDVHVVWRGASSTICYRRSVNNGASFGSVVNLSTGPDDGYLPDIAVYSPMVYVIWIQSGPTYDIRLARSLDDGANWQASALITSDGGTTEERVPRIAAGYQRAYVAWLEIDDATVFTRYSLSSNSGVNWTPKTTLWAEPIDTINQVAIACQGSNVYVVRDAPENGPLQKVSINGGSTFSAEIRLGNGNNYGPEMDAVSVYSQNGCSVYARDSGLFVSNGLCRACQIDTNLSGFVHVDIGVSSSGRRHVVCGYGSSIYYYREVPGDFNGDGEVDLKDFASFAAEGWLSDNCMGCGGYDLTFDGRVSIDDIQKFIEDWLVGIQ